MSPKISIFSQAVPQKLDFPIDKNWENLLQQWRETYTTRRCGIECHQHIEKFYWGTGWDHIGNECRWRSKDSYGQIALRSIYEQELMTSFIFSILHFSVPLQKFFHFTNTTHPWQPSSFKTPCFLLHFDHAMATLPLLYLSRLKSFPFWIYFFFLERSSHHIQISAHIIQTHRGLHTFSCWPKTTPSVTLYPVVWFHFLQNHFTIYNYFDYCHFIFSFLLLSPISKYWCSLQSDFILLLFEYSIYFFLTVECRIY